MKVEELTLEERNLLENEDEFPKLTPSEGYYLNNIVDELSLDFKRTYNEVSKSILLMEDKQSYLNDVIDNIWYNVNERRATAYHLIKSKEGLKYLDTIIKYLNYLYINEFKKLLK